MPGIDEPNMSGIVEPLTDQQTKEIFRRRFPTTAANEAIKLPAASAAGAPGADWGPTYAEQTARIDAEAKRKLYEDERKISGLNTRALERVEAAAKPPPSVAGIEQAISNVTDAIDAPGFFERLTNVLSGPAGGGANPIGTPDAAKAEQTANTIEMQMKGMSPKDKDTAVASFRDSGKLKELQELRASLTSTWDRTTIKSHRALYARTRAAVDRMLAVMTGN
jgi:uncharacterized protein YukE